MAELTMDELNSVNPEKIFDLQFSLNPELWDSIKLPISLPNPIRIEFSDNIRRTLPTSLKHKKGVYFFMVEPSFSFVPDIKYLVYIGRVIQGNTFFKRFYEYEKAVGNYNIKRNRQLMANAWPKKTFVYYYIINDDNDIKIIERELVNKIIPPLNNQFYLKKAQNTRSLYK